MNGRDHVPPEPGHARPIAVDAFGDCWQRQGPPGDASWYSAQPGDQFEFGRTWRQVWVTFGPLTRVTRPRLPEFEDTTTGGIPVVTVPRPPRH